MSTDKSAFNTKLNSALKVLFLRQIFEDDFPEAGMKAWLTKISKEDGCYKLYFDFTDFEERNEKYLTANYFDDKGRPCLTAKEFGVYSNKYSVYFGDAEWDEEFMSLELCKYLSVIDIDRS